VQKTHVSALKKFRRISPIVETSKPSLIDKLASKVGCRSIVIIRNPTKALVSYWRWKNNDQDKHVNVDDYQQPNQTNKGEFKIAFLKYLNVTYLCYTILKYCILFRMDSMGT
jgi:hypothetical protein